VPASVFADAAPSPLDRQRPTLVGLRSALAGRLGRHRGKTGERDVGQYADHKIGERAIVHADVIGCIPAGI